MKKRARRERPVEYVPELPEARPMPYEANPNGVEGVDPGWWGGSSNVGEIINPKPDGPTTYTTADMADAPKVDAVLMFTCDECGEAFVTQALLNVHRRTAHRKRG